MKKHAATKDALDSEPMECWCDACKYAETLDRVVLKYHDANLILDCSSEELKQAFIEVEGGQHVTRKFKHGVLEVREGRCLMSDEYPITEH